ncbi:MAG: ABC transporter permease [Sphaerochaetaceae bacterium]|nr:ABC transporter permease [Sphaerochaetaceae bacterium]
MIIENTKLAFKALVGSKLRTVLSLLGIVIGVASVVTILTLGQSIQTNITDSISSAGPDLITFSPFDSGEEADIFTEEYSTFMASLDDRIETVMAMDNSSTTVRVGQESESANVYGVPSTYDDNLALTFASGEFFALSDSITSRQVVVLGTNVAEELFPTGNAVGNTVMLNRNGQGKSYTVVGVLEDKDAIFSLNFDDSVFIPYSTYQARLNNSPNVGSYIIKVADENYTLDVSDNVEAYYDDLIGEDYFRIMSPTTMAEMATSVTSTLSSFLAAIAAISLLVGGIGIMNIMLVSVSERTKEIGIRKALGAAPAVIRGQFICESLVITLIGGVIGVLIGLAASYGFSVSMGTSFVISTFSIVISMGFSMIIGLFFGWYPALKASQLDPIDALNYE